MKIIKPDKNILRQKGINARESLSFEEIENKSRKITEALIELPEIVNSKEIFCYLSSREKKEVSTFDFIKWALKNDKNIYVPRSNWKEKTLSMHKLKTFAPNEGNFELIYDIWEPKKDYNLEKDWSKLKVVILPGSVGDVKGTRYGLGAGFFDRFLETLSKTNKNFISLLILFQEQVFPEIPRGKTDFPVKIIVTDEKVYRI